MANALPMAIGAQVAAPGRQVVSLSGDGGLAMLMGELRTVETHRLPVKVVVFNNSSLGMVRLEMMVAGDPPFETDHDHVDYAVIATGAGFHTRRVTDPADLRNAVTELLAYDGPALLDVVTRPTPWRCPRTSPSRRPAGSPCPWARPSWTAGREDLRAGPAEPAEHPPLTRRPMRLPPSTTNSSRLSLDGRSLPDDPAMRRRRGPVDRPDGWRGGPESPPARGRPLAARSVTVDG
jgi:hypothetical protein